jgi:hypothetical protein
MTQLLTILEMSMVIEPMAGDDDETVFALMPQMGYLTIDASHRWADQTVSAINRLKGWSAIRIRTGDVTRR